METSDTLGKKLDLILAKLNENNEMLRKILKLTKDDSPTREFLLNLAADLTGNLIAGK